MIKLLPCPFCGKDEKNPPYIHSNKKKHFNENHFTVQCTICGCEPDYCVTTEKECIEKWNTRVKDNQKWISVKDKLPKNLQRVLVCCQQDEFDFYSMCYYANEIFSEYLSECDRHNCLTLSKLVTHWMPLPKKPKECK